MKIVKLCLLLCCAFLFLIACGKDDLDFSREGITKVRVGSGTTGQFVDLPIDECEAIFKFFEQTEFKQITVKEDFGGWAYGIVFYANEEWLYDITICGPVDWLNVENLFQINGTYYEAEENIDYELLESFLK